jgi:DNA-binding GntR family transcriptional regulator
MAEMLRVSRTPVREALLQLEREGLLITQGFERAVTNPTREEFVDLYICRAALERIVAERATRLATRSEIEVMAAAIEEARVASAAGDHAGVLTANTRFHDQMIESARMPPLSRLMNTIRGQILVVRRHLLSDAAVEVAICDEHATLLEAIQEGDAAEAQSSMELHMNNDIQRLAGSGAP